MSSGNCSPVPVFQLGKDDLVIIGKLLNPYEVFVKNRVRPSCKRGMLLVAIETLRQRITYAVTRAEGSLNLTVIEIEIISKSLEVFIEHLPKQAPRSQRRDEVLACCRKLKKQFDAAFITKPYFSSMQS